MEYADIQRLAEEEFAKQGGEIPVPVITVAKAAGIEVFEREMGEEDAGVSGMMREEEGAWRIMINKADDHRRKRFTIAHELGHFMLHRGKSFVDDFALGETFYRADDTSGPLEREANFFAANLLMPESVVRAKWAELGHVDKMVELFWVSAVSMTYRLKYLKLIPDDQ